MDKIIYIVRCGEVALKGQNKPYFERMLASHIKSNLKEFSEIEVIRREGFIYVYADKVNNQEGIKNAIASVFGVDFFTPALEIDTDIENINNNASKYMLDLLKSQPIKTFKVEVKRADKSFPIKSPDMAKEIGATVLKACKVLNVDVHNPQVMLNVDIRKGKTYISHEKIKGFGGLPLGTNGRGMVLLSGGIDSPVAAFMMAKRGMSIEAIHFHSYPHTSERAREKVLKLAEILAKYVGNIKVHCVNLLEIQLEINEKCKSEESTILVRRFMMKIAEKVAFETWCDVLITGENIGQVASQTVDGLVVTDKAVEIPVMRPLVAFDKVDIIDYAKKIGTYETSIMPYEDCCTIFLPKHPVTRPKLEKIEKSEALLSCEELMEKALNDIETVEIKVN